MNTEVIKAFMRSAFYRAAIVGGFLYAVDIAVDLCRAFPPAFRRARGVIQEKDTLAKAFRKGRRKGKRKGAKPGPKAHAAWHNRKKADAPAQQ